MDKNSKIVRKSHIILIGDLILLELFLIFLYLIFRLPSTYLINVLNLTDLGSVDDLFGILYFISLSIFELTLIATIALKWASEEYEVRDDTIST